ncbi:Uncharacterized protein YR821_1241 [Yersinia ruckeri]|uniref:Uncharacterized protein n=1 Tax=Yersinia ruckeri TaxID=29486 RepID=A0A0A8VBX1_YERRU|nr:Uncharacterized protein YR821_1241 [Yersinia ruckeri]CEK27070.1 hypothetical protein CSF007_6565 [Yersinia ruckeri]
MKRSYFSLNLLARFIAKLGDKNRNIFCYDLRRKIVILRILG